MRNAETIWVCALHLPVYRCGGWAFVRSKGDERIGGAGGERQTTARRLALLGLAAALDAPADEPQAPPLSPSLNIVTSSPDLIALSGLFVSRSVTESASLLEGDDDLWALVLKASKGRRLRLAPPNLRVSAPIAFVSAWAELASSKAKGGGAFRAAIPKSNLAKFSVN